MNKYSDIEIQTAKNLLKDGYKWLVRTMRGNVVAFSCEPYKIGGYWSWPGNAESEIVSGKSTPLFQSIKREDPGPTYIEDILNPKILNEAERQYLSAVIRPFRDQVQSITKFEDSTMYKGMELGKEYTLEELGL